MKNKIFLSIITVFFSLILFCNISYGYFDNNPKCKCENCVCTECKCGDNCTCNCSTCQGCSVNCKDGKCKFEGNSTDNTTKVKYELKGNYNTIEGEIKERCCTKSANKTIINKTGEAQGLNDSGKVCPVSGEKIEGAGVTYVYMNKTYTFCCEECIVKFKEEPMNYVKQEEFLCPVMGEPAEKDLFLMYNGAKYYFCCKPCMKKFDKEPEKYSKGFGNY